MQGWGCLSTAARGSVLAARNQIVDGVEVEVAQALQEAVGEELEEGATQRPREELAELVGQAVVTEEGEEEEGETGAGPEHPLRAHSTPEARAERGERGNPAEIQQKRGNAAAASERATTVAGDATDARREAVYKEGGSEAGGDGNVAAGLRQGVAGRELDV